MPDPGGAEDADLREAIRATAWVDTHEHIIEESGRLGVQAYVFSNQIGETFRIPRDWSVLLSEYTLAEMISAGLAPGAAEMIRGDSLSPLEKWTLAADAFAAVRHGGYARVVDLTTERLFGARLSRASVESIDAALHELWHPGFYRTLLCDIAKVSRCQVHSLEIDPFCESAEPDLLEQDISAVPLLLGSNPHAERLSGIDVDSLADYLDVVEWVFETYAPRAVAMKCAWAYQRGLAVGPVGPPPAAAFARVRAGAASGDERRSVEDFLFHRCVDIASGHGLPVKLHMGHLDGNQLPQQRHVFDHVRDVTAIVQAHPATTFVLMHMAWPQQDQLLALAKHQPNVTVDLCWSWAIAPLQTRTFVKHFLTSVPANKLLCFGADVFVAENVVGHAELARQGLQKALEGLIADDWLTPAECLALVPHLMRENAERVLPSPRHRDAGWEAERIGISVDRGG